MPPQTYGTPRYPRAASAKRDAVLESDGTVVCSDLAAALAFSASKRLASSAALAATSAACFAFSASALFFSSLLLEILLVICAFNDFASDNFVVAFVNYYSYFEYFD